MSTGLNRGGNGGLRHASRMGEFIRWAESKGYVIEIPKTSAYEVARIRGPEGLMVFYLRDGSQHVTARGQAAWALLRRFMRECRRGVGTPWTGRVCYGARLGDDQ